MLNERIRANFQRTMDFLPKKLSLSSQKYGFRLRDPGSGKKPIPDPRVIKAPDPGSRIRIRNTVNLCTCSKSSNEQGLYRCDDSLLLSWLHSAHFHINLLR
jgi:hypothetical protein